MSPQIDHVVVAVADLDRAARIYEGLGFTLTPRAQHPSGTANRLIQFPGRNFIELLAVDRPNLLFEHDPRAQPPVFAFGAFNRDFLRGGDGLSMLVLASEDSRADVAHFAAAGLATYAPFDFERAATLPDGRTVKVAFSVAFATHPDMPRAAFFTCHNRFPENFWKPAYQEHRNGAQAISEIVMVAERPDRFAEFCAGFTGGRVQETAHGIVADCGPQFLTILAPSAFEARFAGQKIDLRHGPRLAAIVIEGSGERRDVTPSGAACGVAIEWQTS